MFLTTPFIPSFQRTLESSVFAFNDSLDSGFRRNGELELYLSFHKQYSSQK